MAPRKIIEISQVVNGFVVNINRIEGHTKIIMEQIRARSQGKPKGDMIQVGGGHFMENISDDMLKKFGKPEETIVFERYSDMEQYLRQELSETLITKDGVG